VFAHTSEETTYRKYKHKQSAAKEGEMAIKCQGLKMVRDGWVKL